MCEYCLIFPANSFQVPNSQKLVYIQKSGIVGKETFQKWFISDFDGIELKEGFN